MAYQTPITVSEALRRVELHQYVLPAIQREVVWEPSQICLLFDSLLRQYPIGTFLFWEVEPELASKLQFYEVLQDIDVARTPHSPRVRSMNNGAVTAVLDGQQRLTAFNIGLRGSYVRRSGGRNASSTSSGGKILCLDLLFEPADGDEEEYRFEFRAESDARKLKGSSHWFPVRDVLSMDAGPDINEYLRAQHILDSPNAFRVLYELRESVLSRPAINFYIERGQSMSKVLDIFVRVNSGGTVLSKSDLLLSIATAQFKNRDARESIHGLLDDLNSTGRGFALTKDTILKTGLLVVANDPVVKPESFSTTNVEGLEAQWESIDQSLRTAVRLLASFGFCGRNLSASSVVIPIADYLHSRGLGGEYVDHARFREDREVVRRWVLRSMIKPGVWSAALNGLLSSLHSVFVSSTHDAFPIEQVEHAMARLGKSLVIQDEQLDEIIDQPYRAKRSFPILSMLYPAANSSGESHEDHVFPKSMFTESRLKAAGRSTSEIVEMRQRFDRLPNLQLLPSSQNQSKSSQLPAEWIRQQHPDSSQRAAWMSGNDLLGLPEDLAGFVDFYDKRRELMKDRLMSLLGDGRAPSAPFDPPSAGTSPHAPPAIPAFDNPPAKAPVPSVGRPPRSRSTRSRSRQSRTSNSYDTSRANGSRYFILRRGRKATARIEDGMVIVESGSLCQPVQESLSSANRTFLQNLLDQGVLVADTDGFKFVKDQSFKSPSSAASIILGLSANGRTEFINESGQNLGEMTKTPNAH